MSFVAAMHFVTDLGDSLVLLPLALLLLLWLACRTGLRAAFLWALALVVCGAGTAALKIYFHACPSPLASLQSPSGHASLSTLIYGGLVLIVGTEREPMQRLFVTVLGIGLVVGIALSRVLVGAHSATEALVGLMIGAAALAIVAPVCIRAQLTAGQAACLVAAIALILLALHGRSASFEHVWRFGAAYLQDRAGLCAR